MTMAMPSARALAATPSSLQAVSPVPALITIAEWTLWDAVELCRQIEAICPQYGCHVALTGGTLYKDGARKDCDILFYRIRQVEQIDVEGLFSALATIGLEKVSGFGWCHKAKWRGKPIDCFFPESDGGEYERADPQDLPLNLEFL